MTKGSPKPVRLDSKTEKWEDLDGNTPEIRRAHAAQALAAAGALALRVCEVNVKGKRLEVAFSPTFF